MRLRKTNFSDFFRYRGFFVDFFEIEVDSDEYGLMFLAHLSMNELVDCRRTEIEGADAGSSQVERNLARLFPTQSLYAFAPELVQWILTLSLHTVGAIGLLILVLGVQIGSVKEERRAS